MRTFVFFFIYFLSVSLLHAQDSLRSKKSISINQGFTYMLTKDLYRSPYVYRGINPFIELSFGINSTKSVQQIHSRFTFGKIRTPFSPLAPFSLLCLDYSYLRKISSVKRFNFYVGPQLSGTGWKVNYFPEMQVPIYGQVNSYMLAFSLGAAAKFQYKLSRKSYLTLFVSAPLCAYVDRPNFLDGSTRETKLNGLNFWNPSVRLTYEYTVSEKVSIYVRYEYQYLHYPQPKPIHMLNNSLSMGIKLKFQNNYN